MKKMFAASLVAIMAVSAANAEIASVSYTNKAITEKTGDISTLATTAKSNLTAAVNELAGKVGTQDVGAQVSAALDSAKDYTDALADGAVKANTQAIAALDSTYATDTALTDGLVLKEDAANKATSFDDTNANDVKFPTTAAVKSYVSASVSTINTDLAATQGTLGTLAETVATNKSAAETGIQEAKTAAANALTDAKKYTDDEVKELADGAVAGNTAAISAINNETTGILAQAKADAASKDTALETKITNAYTAADSALETALKQYADNAAAGASGEAGEVASDLAEYIQSNNTAVSAAQAQADKGVADAAAAKKAADDAQATANANTTAISKLGETYATDAELNTAKSDIKTAYEAADVTTLSSAKTYAKEYADGLAGNYATAAQGAKADSAVQKADVTTGTTNGTIKVQDQEVSVAGLGTAAYTASTAYATAAQGTKADTAMQESALKGLASWSSAGCATGTCSLVSKSGTIQWEAVKYAE